MEVRENVEKFLSLLAVDPELIDEQTGMAKFNVENIRKNVGLEYEGLNGFKSIPANAVSNDRELLLYLLRNNERTVELSETIEYLIKILVGEIEVDPTRNERYTPIPISAVGSGSGSYVGGNLAEKLWWALKDEGYSDVAIAAVLGNGIGESGNRTNNLENRTDANQRNFPDKYLQLEMEYTRTFRKSRNR